MDLAAPGCDNDGELGDGRQSLTERESTSLTTILVSETQPSPFINGTNVIGEADESYIIIRSGLTIILETHADSGLGNLRLTCYTP
jgi:hypothetical protein